MAAKEDNAGEEKREEEESKKQEERATRRSIPPATAYAFIIIHEIPRRRFRGLPLRATDRIGAADRGREGRKVDEGKRRERGERGGGRRARRRILSRCGEKIYRRNKSKVILPHMSGKDGEARRARG